MNYLNKTEIKKFFKDTLIKLILSVGVICSTLYIKDMFENDSPIDQSKFVIFLVILGITYFIMEFIEIVKKLQFLEELKNKDKQKERELEILKPVSVEFVTNDSLKDNHREDKAYQRSLNEVKNAKNQILIVADFSPAQEQIEVTDKRQDYYKAIEEVLKNRINSNSDEQFTYVRYMQRDEEKFRKIHNKKGVIDEYDLIAGDEQAFHHCKRVLEITGGKAIINLELYVSRNIPSLPSILIVDENKLLFTIPERLKNKSKIETAGVLDFTDNTYRGKAIVKPFIKIIRSLNQDSEEYIRIKKIHNFSNEDFQKWS